MRETRNMCRRIGNTTLPLNLFSSTLKTICIWADTWLVNKFRKHICLTKALLCLLVTCETLCHVLLTFGTFSFASWLLKTCVPPRWCCWCPYWCTNFIMLVLDLSPFCFMIYWMYLLWLAALHFYFLKSNLGVN